MLAMIPDNRKKITCCLTLWAEVIPAYHQPQILQSFMVVDCSFYPEKNQGVDVYSQIGCGYACQVQSWLNRKYLSRDRDRH